MLQVANLSTTKRLPGIVCFHQDMRVRLTASVLPPWAVQDSTGYIKYIDLHPVDKNALESSSTLPGEYKLVYPPILYVELDGVDQEFLPPTTCSRHLDTGFNDGCADCIMHKGLVQIKAQKATWYYVDDKNGYASSVDRLQLPIMPEKACPLYGLQGTTADPGLIAHWAMPRRMDNEVKWLMVYVMLSRVRSLDSLASFGLTSKIREIMESGPPENLVGNFDRLFGDKAKATKVAARKAREALGWPLP